MTFPELCELNHAWCDTTTLRVLDTGSGSYDFYPISVRAAKVVYRDFTVCSFYGDVVTVALK